MIDSKDKPLVFLIASHYYSYKHYKNNFDKTIIKANEMNSTFETDELRYKFINDPKKLKGYRDNYWMPCGYYIESEWPRMRDTLLMQNIKHISELVKDSKETK